MKHCPTCNRSYADTQAFCIEDGTPLSGDAPPDFEPQPTIVAQPPPAPSQPSAPYPATPQSGAFQTPSWPASGPQQAPQTPGGRSKLPWILGGLAVLLVGIIGLGAIIVFLVYRSASSNTTTTTHTTRNTTTNTKTYVNSRSNFTGKLAENYVDFSFDYPADWKLDPKAGKGDSTNFVKVERSISDAGGNYTLENFGVGWYTGTGTMSGDRALFPEMVQQFSSQFGRSFPEYQKVSEGETKVGQYSGYEFRFKSRAKGTPKGDVSFWGRVVMVPGGSSAQPHGVAIVMLATSLAPEIHSAEDVGEKGELPVILNSFRMGSGGGESGASNTGANANENADAVSNANQSAASATNSAQPGASNAGPVGSGDGEDAPDNSEEVLQQLSELETEWGDANVKGDRDALERILADEFIGTAGDGSVQKKKDYLSTLKPDPTIKSQTFTNLNLSLRSSNAILTGINVVKFSDGTPARYRFTDTFVWRDGRWQAISSQASRVK